MRKNAAKGQQRTGSGARTYSVILTGVQQEVIRDLAGRQQLAFSQAIRRLIDLAIQQMERRGE